MYTGRTRLSTRRWWNDRRPAEGDPAGLSEQGRLHGFSDGMWFALPILPYQYATSVGYFRGGKKGKEIDIVVGYPNTKNILIEVKYREGAPIADDAIVELCEESSAAIVVTKNADDFGVHNTKCGKDLLRIPAFAFLYLLGNAEKHGYRGMEQ